MNSEPNKEDLAPVTSAQVAYVYALAQAKILEGDELDFEREDFSVEDFLDFDNDYRDGSFATVNEREMYTGFVSVALAEPEKYGFLAMIAIAESELEIEIENAAQESDNVLHEITTYVIVCRGFRLGMLKSVILDMPKNLNGVDINEEESSKALILQDEVDNIMTLLRC